MTKEGDSAKAISSKWLATASIDVVMEGDELSREPQEYRCHLSCSGSNSGVSTCGTKLRQMFIGWLDLILLSRLTGPFPLARSKYFSSKVRKGGTLGLGVTGLFCGGLAEVDGIEMGSASCLSTHLAMSLTSSVSSSDDKYKSSTEHELRISISSSSLDM